MKFDIERAELLQGLARIQSIVERRSTLPILSNALLRVTPEDVILAATDLEVGVVASLEASVQKPGAMTVGAKKLYEIVRELEETPISVELEEGSRLRLECGSTRFSLLAVSPEEYPSVPSAEGIPLVAMEPALLGEMIDRTLYATSTDETRYNLNGIFMEVLEEGPLRFVATDGHRLAKIDKSPAEALPFLDKGIIVPRKGVSEIRKFCEDLDGRIEIGLDAEGFLVVRRPRLLLSCRLIDGEFPSYRQVLPGEPRARLVLERDRLLHAVRRIALVASERSRGFRFSVSEGEIELSSSNPDLGEARELLPCEYRGDALHTGFNARYVLDALGAITAKEVVVELTDELAPVQLRPADDPDQLAVIMPMRM